MKRILSLISALALTVVMSVSVCAEPLDTTVSDGDILLAAEEIVTDLNEVIGEIAGAVNGADTAADTYAYASDPAGEEGGSIIEFTQANYVVDKADAFTDDEEAVLFQKITEIRNTYKFDTVILTTLSTDGKTAEAYTDDYFDYNGYGYGSDRNGVIIMLCLGGGEGERDVHISGRGSVGTSVFNSYYVLDFDEGPIYKEILPLLSDGRYYDAEVKFLELADRHLRWNAEGDSDDGDYGSDGFFTSYPARTIVIRELVAVGVACIIALIVVLLLKRKMKTNRIQASAANYEKPGSMKVTASNEYFIRNEVTRTAIPKNDDSDSGNHTSSSGASHSGGGGKF